MKAERSTLAPPFLSPAQAALRRDEGGAKRTRPALFFWDRRRSLTGEIAFTRASRFLYSLHS